LGGWSANTKKVKVAPLKIDSPYQWYFSRSRAGLIKTFIQVPELPYLIGTELQGDEAVVLEHLNKSLKKIQNLNVTEETLKQIIGDDDDAPTPEELKSNLPEDFMEVEAEEINRLHSEWQRRSLPDFIRIGELLTKVKKECIHGEWMGWMNEHLQFSHQMASIYMRAYERRNDPKLLIVSNLTGVSRALVKHKKPEPQPKEATPKAPEPLPVPKVSPPTPLRSKAQEEFLKKAKEYFSLLDKDHEETFVEWLAEKGVIRSEAIKLSYLSMDKDQKDLFWEWMSKEEEDLWKKSSLKQPYEQSQQRLT
jgi:hypothetical protein